MGKAGQKSYQKCTRKESHSGSVSCIIRPSYTSSKFLANILKHLVGKTERSLHNCTAFAEKVKLVTIKPHETMVSFDVVSLFTDVPIALAIEVVNRRLMEDDGWKQAAGALSPMDVCDMLASLPHTLSLVKCITNRFLAPP